MTLRAGNLIVKSEMYVKVAERLFRPGPERVTLGENIKAVRQKRFRFSAADLKKSAGSGVVIKTPARRRDMRQLPRMDRRTVPAAGDPEHGVADFEP